MQINLNWDTSVSAAPSFFKAAVQQAANLLSATLLNPISVSIQVGWNEDGGTPMTPNSGGLGGDNSAAFANASALSSNNVQAISLLVNQANLNGTPGVVAPLPTSNPFTNGYLILSPAEARIMGVPNPGATTYDGAVGFALPSYTTYNEMVDAALHEIAHALGRINGYEAGGPLWYTPLDLYTYSAPGQLWNPTSSTPGYFSLNGGITNLGTFSGPDPADFANLADPFGYTDTNVTTLSPLDQKVMQTLGFDVATNQPVLAPNTITSTAPNSLFTGSGGGYRHFQRRPCRLSPQYQSHHRGGHGSGHASQPGWHQRIFECGTSAVHRHHLGVRPRNHPVHRRSRLAAGSRLGFPGRQ
ncbi:MAG: NF038122 family metalloprotease [Ferrovum myxofaciens]|nr:NF038122 family metalloprotease [Ferrovum myxofaciens]MBU6994285.1 NF038122 family metalloprotease [Ferrovum myxofaciens]